MLPGIQSGEFVLTEGDTEPARGEVVVYEEPLRRRAVVKRAVGVARDLVDVRRGRAWVNGEALDEPYIYSAPPHSLDSIYVPQVRMGPRRVPEGYLFCLGDNRNGSVDSRDYGPVSRERYLGRVLYVIWSHDWARIGMLVR